VASLDDLLAHTLVRTAARETGVETLRVDAFEVRRPRPDPIPDDLDDEERIPIVRGNQLWQWAHGPTPGIFHHITCRSRGMGMNYQHAMPVADAVVFDYVRIKRPEKLGWIELPLHDPFVLHREFLPRGFVPEGRSGWWPCKLPLDASGIVVLGYQALGDAIVPITDRAILESPAFIPNPKDPAFLRFVAGEQNEAVAVIDHHRYLVVLEFATGREDNTFVAGLPMGFARLHPLVWVVSSEKLDAVEVQTTIQRPKKTVSHGDPTMMDEIKAMATTDTNQNVMATWYPEDKALMWWDTFFSAVEDDAYQAFKDREPQIYANGSQDHPLQKTGEVTLTDPRYTNVRTIRRAILRLRLEPSHEYDSVTKLPRQGQFDNIHMAPRMQIIFRKRKWPTAEDLGEVTLDNIAMAPFCAHDCLHLHARWGIAHKEKSFRGFSGATPHMIAGGTCVPTNQVVFASFPGSSTVRLRCVAENVLPGEPQIFNHHGLGYVCDIWPGGELLIESIKTTIDLYALNLGEPYPYMPDDGDGWAKLYWRLRYGGRGDEIVERLVPRWEKVMAPEE
jgi:hypothetical protein